MNPTATFCEKTEGKMEMKEGRREFLKAGAMTAAAAAVPGTLRALGTPGSVAGANDRVRVGLVGLRGRGENHITGYGHLPNVEIAALCDIDDNVMAQRLAQVQKMGFQPETYSDVRKMLENKTIDAVSIATPHHWHALIAVWAMQAGKDVYVEKPCSYNLWEGKQLVRATAKYNRIVQHGTQSRSLPSMIDAMQKLQQESILGDVYLSRGLCFKWRDTIGHTPVSPVPAGVHYDMWTGPAPLKPFTKNHFHYNWHWFWDYGNGDLGNQGIHQLDIARWGLGPGFGFPNKISAVGGHVMFDDDQQTPNVLNCVFEYDRPGAKPVFLEFEVRHWMTNPEAGIGVSRRASSASGERAEGGLGPVEGGHNSIGNIFYGPNGYLVIDNAAGYQSFLGKNQDPGPAAPIGKEDHFANFIACVISRKKEDLRAPIEEGHHSAGLAHLANASYRLGRTLHFDPKTETVIGDEEANHLLSGADRGYRAPFVFPEVV
jgi:predicted dehydrogenase